MYNPNDYCFVTKGSKSRGHPENTRKRQRVSSIARENDFTDDKYQEHLKRDKKDMILHIHIQFSAIIHIVRYK